MRRPSTWRATSKSFASRRRRVNGSCCSAVEKLRAQRFERRHPLWRMWFLTGLPDGKVAMFVKVHHTVGDGLAAMTIISTFLDSAPSVLPSPPQPWVPRRAPLPSQLVADNLLQRLSAISRTLWLLARPLTMVRTPRAAWPATRELLAEAPGDRTSIDRVVGQRSTPGPSPGRLPDCQAHRAHRRRVRERRPAGSDGCRCAPAPREPRRGCYRRHCPDICPGVTPPTAARSTAGERDRADGRAAIARRGG